MLLSLVFFFFNDTATTDIYTLSLHDALPIWFDRHREGAVHAARSDRGFDVAKIPRSEEHTSELQSRQYLVCRLLLEKKKQAKSAVSLTTSTASSAPPLNTGGTKH